MDVDACSRRIRLVSPLPLIVWVALLITQLLSPDKAWMALLVGLGVLILIAFVWARSLRDHVSADRHTLGTWVVAGDQLRERWTLANRGWLPVLWARIHDHSEAPGYRVDRVETAPPHAGRTWSTAGVCLRRGVFRLGPWSVEMRDPLGFFRVDHSYGAAATIMVYPRASFLPNLDLPRGRAPGRAASSERSFEDTVQVGSLRPYVAGDPLRRVAWHASAHRIAAGYHDLLVHEYDREPSGDLWLVLDMDASVQAGAGAETTEEYAVILAASLAAQYLRQGERRAVGLVMAGRTPALIPPGRGQPQLWRILAALVEAGPAPDASLAALLEQTSPVLGSGRTLVLITPSVDPAWVAPLLPLLGRGNAPTAILLDAATFGGGQPMRAGVATEHLRNVEPHAFAHPSDRLDPLTGLRSLLARYHIPATVIAQGFPFRPIERIRRERIESKTLGGTGRVISVQVEEEV